MSAQTLLNVCGGIALGALTLFVIAWLIVLMIWISTLARRTELIHEKADRRLALEDRIEFPDIVGVIGLPIGGLVGAAIAILVGLPFMIVSWIAGVYDGDFDGALGVTEQILYVGIIVAVSVAILVWGFVLGWFTLSTAVRATLKTREESAAYSRQVARAAAEAERKRREEEAQRLAERAQRRLAARPRLFRRRQKAIAQ